MRWQDPPEKTNRPVYGQRYAQEAQEYREHPGWWGILTDFPPERNSTARTTAARIRTGGFSSFRPAGHFDARTATEENEDGKTVVNLYVRYVGEEPESAPENDTGKSDTAVLHQLTVADLRGLARGLDISGYASMRKEKLIEMIEERTGAG